DLIEETEGAQPLGEPGLLGILLQLLEALLVELAVRPRDDLAETVPQRGQPGEVLLDDLADRLIRGDVLERPAGGPLEDPREPQEPEIDDAGRDPHLRLRRREQLT